MSSMNRRIQQETRDERSQIIKGNVMQDYYQEQQLPQLSFIEQNGISTNMMKELDQLQLLCFGSSYYDSDEYGGYLDMTVEGRNSTSGSICEHKFESGFKVDESLNCPLAGTPTINNLLYSQNHDSFGALIPGHASDHDETNQPQKPLTHNQYNDQFMVNAITHYYNEKVLETIDGVFSTIEKNIIEKAKNEEVITPTYINQLVSATSLIPLHNVRKLIADEPIQFDFDHYVTDDSNANTKNDNMQYIHVVDFCREEEDREKLKRSQLREKRIKSE